MYYGFAMEGNPYDSIQISIEQEAQEEEELETEVKKVRREESSLFLSDSEDFVDAV